MSKIIKISENFSYKELTKSETAQRLGIKNEPNDEELDNLKYLAVNLLEQIRFWINKNRRIKNIAIRVTNAFRCVELNNAIPGSSKTSHHLKGMAADITDCFSLKHGVDLWNIFDIVTKGPDGKNPLMFTQCIIYKSEKEIDPIFIHLSLDKNNVKRQVLYCYYTWDEKGKKKTTYLKNIKTRIKWQ